MARPFDPGPALAGEAVDLYHLSLTAAAVDETDLDAAERQRARRYRIGDKRVQFTAARAQLRRILAGYLDADPASLSFGYGEHGKPFLPAHPDLAFNLSHSGQVGLLAVTRGTEVGVDVERARPGRRFAGIAKRFFAAAECAALLALPEDRRAAAFYRAWTAKEAYLKAWGTGLSFPSNRFTIEYAAAGSGEGAAPLRLVASEMPGEEVSAWRLVAVPAGPGHAAALCYRGESRWLRHVVPSQRVGD